LFQTVSINEAEMMKKACQKTLAACLLFSVCGYQFQESLHLGHVGNTSDVNPSCDIPEGNTCVCINAKWPCYMYREGKQKCTCTSISDKATCEESYGGQLCERPADCVNNCAVCKSDTACSECSDGFHVIGGQCVSESMFSEVSHGVKENLVLLGSADLFGYLQQAFAGTIERSQAVNLALRAFFHYYEDDFDFVVVFPESTLTGQRTHAENFHLKGDDSHSSKLRSAVIMNMYSSQTSAIPLFHELEHEWGVFSDIETLTPGRLRTSGPHWGMSVMNKRGMLGGFPASAVTCTTGTLGDTSCGQPLRWDFSQGSATTSHDGIGGYNNFDLLIMGLERAKNMPDEKLIFCEGASKVHGSGVEDVTCSTIHVISSEDIEGALKGGESNAHRDHFLTPGDELRVAVVTVLSSADAAKAQLETETFEEGSPFAWLNNYIGETPAKFHEATGQRASISFAVTPDDSRTSSAAILEAADEALESVGPEP